MTYIPELFRPAVAALWGPVACTIGCMLFVCAVWLLNQWWVLAAVSVPTLSFIAWCFVSPPKMESLQGTRSLQ